MSNDDAQEIMLPGTPATETPAAAPGQDEVRAVQATSPKRRTGGASSTDKIVEMFHLLDEDGSGALDKNEVSQLAKKLGDKLKPKDLRDAFSRMDRSRSGEVSLADFQHWWKYKKEEDRRALRATAREVFETCDADRSGFIDKEEVVMVAEKIRKKCNVELDPPFDAEKDFELMDVNSIGEVSFAEFEAWLRSRTGDEDADIPVLPESMVKKINEFSESIGLGSVVGQAATSLKIDRSGANLWRFLKPRLRKLVQLEKQWGNIHQLYSNSTTTSLFEQKPLPRGIRSPDATFSVVWDVFQIFALLYVALMVPLRTGFAVEVPIESSDFVIEVIVDAYFITDLLLSFRTAYWRSDGMLEIDAHSIAINYLKGWFTIDFVSCLPVQYVGIVMGDGGGEEAGKKLKALKTLRLLRLAKLLRLARIKRILEKYQDVFDVQPFLGLIFTLFMIFFSAHILACFWYMAGTACDKINGEEETCGWVTNPAVDGDSGRPWTGVDIEAKKITLGVRYITSMYTILKSEFAFTDTEFTFGVFSELVVGFIYGALAGVMATMMQGAKAGEQEYMAKLAALKAWMKARDLKKTDSQKILAYYRARSKGTSSFDEGEILADMPPSLSGEITTFLYARFLKEVPIFRGLGTEVMTHLCGLVTPMSAIKEQVVMQKGQVGSEMYFIIDGEVEVLDGEDRLGFLGEGSFFGESPVLETIFGKRGNGAEIRTRTIRCTSGEVSLGYITKEDIADLLESFPELEIRLKKFSQLDKKFSAKGAKRKEMESLKADAMSQMKEKEKRKGSTTAAVERESEGAPTAKSILAVVEDRHAQRTQQIATLIASLQSVQGSLDSDRMEFASGLRTLDTLNTGEL